MSEKIKERHDKMSRDMYVKKEHYKMYKSGDRWVSAKITAIAGVALFSTVLLGTGNQANADTINNSAATPSVVKTASSATTTKDTAPAVANTSTQTANTKANSTTQNVNSKPSTTDKVNTPVASKPVQPATTSSSQKGMNVEVPHGNLDNAVSNAKKDGVQVTQGATKNVSTDANHASSAESSIANDYKNQTNTVNKADAQQKQVNSARDTANNHTNVDNAVKKAQAAGVNITKDSDKTIKGTVSDAPKAQSQISSDYNSEIQAIQNAINQQKKYDQAYQQEMDKYNQALANYHKELSQDGVKDFDKWVKNHPGVNPNGASAQTVQNVFDLMDEPDSICNISNTGDVEYIKCPVKIAKDKNGKEFAYPDVSGISNLPAGLQYLKGFPTQLQGDALQLPIHGETDWHSKYIYIIVPKNGTNVNGQVATFTYTGLKNTTYNGQPVSKIVVDYTNLVGGQKGLDYVDPGKDTVPTLWVASDFEEGMMIHSKSVDVAVHLYDSNGNEIKTDSNAYMTFGSISHDANHQEYIKALNGDKMIAVKGSSIAITDNGTLAEGDWQNNEVPGGNDDPHGGVFYGDSALLQSANNSNGFYFQMGANNKNDNTPKGQWVSPCTVIPIAPPTLPTRQHANASYHYDVADLPNAQANYHYDGLNISPDNVKSVAAGTVQDASTDSIDGKNVVQGQSLTFTLSPSALPANRTDDMKTFSVVDKLDRNFDYTGYKAYLGSTDVTNDFTPVLTKGADGQWTVTFTASSALLSAMNKDKSKVFVIPKIDIYGTALNGGKDIKNDYVEKINNSSWTSNTVNVNSEKPGTPVKTVDNADGQDANNGNVARGDALIYHVSMDLTNQSKDTVLTPDTIAKGLWITDKMPNGVTVNTAGIRVNGADGKDITSQFTITDEGGQIKVAAKDPTEIIKEYGGTKLDITIPTTVNDDFTGDIKNTAQQNTFGITTDSNTVVDHVPPMNPTKDVVANLSNPSSLNGKSITLGSYFDYDLNSSTRSADYVGKTTEWGMQDHLDTQHDEFTGQWQVIADHPFVLQDGTAIKAGSDISKYFTMTYNTKTGEIDFEANKDFLDIMNLPANKKTAQGWTALFQCKRIAPGTVYNTFSETYNGRVKKSNTVKTTTPEPKKPEPSTKKPVPVKATPVQPAKPTPVVAKVQPKATPATPVLATPAPVKAAPAPEKQAMPQTGEEENNEAALVGLAALGMVGMMSLGLRKKRYDD